MPMIYCRKLIYVFSKVLSKFSLLILLGLFFSIQTHSDYNPEIKLSSGLSIIGLYDELTDTESFLGVPFAEPPVNELRWSPPIMPNHSDKVRKVQSYGPSCMQGPHIYNWYRTVAQNFGSEPDVIKNPKTSEDCLYLNIWRPAGLNESEKLPTIVYIHGGSNKGGWSFEPNYVGDNFAKHGVILISIAYRLGVFGYFSHPQLKSANFGLLDQIHALNWIHKNAHNLGIDKKNITIMGESVGASAAGFMVASPHSSQLFSKIIFQSGGFSFSEIPHKSEHDPLGIKFEEYLIDEVSENPIDKLRELDSNEILKAAEVVFSNHRFTPVIDDQSLFRDTSLNDFIMQLGGKNLIIGSNENEWLMYVDENQLLDTWLETQVEKESLSALKFLIDKEKSDLETIDSLMSAKIFACPSLLLAKTAKTSGSTVWFYYFTRKRVNAVAASMGAYHGAELPYVFDKHDDWLLTVKKDRNLTRDLQKYWTNFAKFGDPNDDTLEHWQSFEVPERTVFYLGDNYKTESHPSEKFCQYL